MSDSQPPFSIPGENPSPQPPPLPPLHQPPHQPPYHPPGGFAPPPKKKMTVVWVLLGVLGFCILLTAGGIVWGFKSLENAMTKEITAPPNAGRPTFTELSDGWVKASFPEFPMTVELPMEVVLTPQKELGFEEGDGVLTDHFVMYDTRDTDKYCSVIGHWLTSLGMLANTGEELPTYAEEFIAGMELESPKPLSVIAKPKGAVTLLTKNKYLPDASIDMRFLFAPFKKGVVVIYLSSAESTPEDFERICRTMKVD